MSAPTPGPCAVYTDIASVRACGDCDDETAVPDALITSAIAFASRIMFLATGEQFWGECTVEGARPCGCSSCCGPVQEMGWATILWPGSSCSGRCHDAGQCGCTWVPTVDLGRSPISSIDEVKIDGAILDPSAYRLDSYRWLRRIDGDGWPICQNLRLADTEVGTFAVSFKWGQPAPATVVTGTNALACEIAKDCAGLDCALPGRVQNITRQGISAVLLDPQQFLEDGLTGVYAADLAIQQENPGGHRAEPRMFSPADPGSAYQLPGT